MLRAAATLTGGIDFCPLSDVFSRKPCLWNKLVASKSVGTPASYLG